MKTDIEAITLYREDFDRLDTTIEEEAARFDDDVDVTIEDTRPDSPGPDVDTDALEAVATSCIDAEWDASLDVGTLTLQAERGPVSYVLAWSTLRQDGEPQLDGRTAETLVDDREVAKVEGFDSWDAVTSPDALREQVRRALETLANRTSMALQRRADVLLEETERMA